MQKNIEFLKLLLEALSGLCPEKALAELVIEHGRKTTSEHVDIAVMLGLIFVKPYLAGIKLDTSIRLSQKARGLIQLPTNSPFWLDVQKELDKIEFVD
jgi:hypothetical protein